MGGPVVLVTGLPAAGKTTLARRLVAELSLPLLSKDVVKESLFDALGVRDRAWSVALSAAAADVLWSLVPDCPTGVIVEVWLDPVRDVGVAERGLARAGAAHVVELMCRCPGELAAERYAARTRHPGHLPPDEATLQRIRDTAPLMAPLGIGPALEVDTTAPVDLAAVVDWLTRQNGPPESST